MLTRALESIISGWVHLTKDCPVVFYLWGRVLYQLASIQTDPFDVTNFANYCIKVLTPLIQTNQCSAFPDMYLHAAFSWIILGNSQGDLSSYREAHELFKNYLKFHKNPDQLVKEIRTLKFNMELKEYFGVKSKMSQLYETAVAFAVPGYPELSKEMVEFQIKYLDTILRTTNIKTEIDLEFLFS
eukprot:TRINITY_DN10752_c0_g1_i6.p1 TRINITY_DN10752_c0_g1~~TRINITY_DN10752_c0_g1_i6.p1  ORF type:complete len:185 (+),score=31.93 TRINITY_DN10752_c0_g1_i6:142-696(+)